MSSSRCPTCPGKNFCVQGDGPDDAEVMCIGEAPGREEDRGGRPFIGAAGLEFNENYLHLAGLRRDDIYITNTVKCRPAQNKKPTYNEAMGCAGHFIPEELKRVDPAVVILMGATANLLIGGMDLESEHGIPRQGKIFDWEGWIVPMFHPAAGLHDTSVMTPLLDDWAALEPWLRTGRWSWAEDGKKRDYGVIECQNDFWAYVEKYEDEFAQHLLIGGDTESHDRKPWSMQFSVAPWTARMIMAENFPMMMLFGEWLIEGLKTEGLSLELVLHNASADLDIFEEVCGNKLDGYYRDTMQESYQFANLPQKLKALSRRLLGRKRFSWEETVTPPSKDVLSRWMMEGFVHAEENWTQKTERVSPKTGKTLKAKIVKSESERVLSHLMKHMAANDEYPADMSLWEKTREMLGETELGRLTGAVGPMPQRGIAHCSLADAVYYGCSDADDTLALAIMFDKMREDTAKKIGVLEEDVDR